MILQLRCPNCNVLLKVPDTAVGKKGKCPKCGADFVVPRYSKSDYKAVASSHHAENPRTGRAVSGDRHDDAEESEGYPLWLKVLVVAAGLFVVVLPLYVFWPKDKWEQNNKVEIIALANDAASLEKGGKDKEAIGKCDQLLGLVGDRKLRGDDLVNAVNLARQVKQRGEAEVARQAQAEKDKNLAEAVKQAQRDRKLQSQLV